MTRRLLNLTLVLLLIALAGCGSVDEPAGSAAEIADRIFAEAGVEPFGDTFSLDTPEDVEFFLGSTNYPDFVDSAVVMPLINLDTRVLYVLKVASESEAEDVMTQLEEDVDPAKLICVVFSMDDVITDSRGAVVFMVIDSDHDERDALAEAFEAID